MTAFLAPLSRQYDFAGCLSAVAAGSGLNYPICLVSTFRIRTSLRSSSYGSRQASRLAINHAAFHDQFHCAEGADRFGRVAFDRDDIGEEAGFDRS